MSASDFMYFSLGFIFYKYLSEKIELYVNDELEADETTFQKVWQSDDEEMKEEIKAMCVDNLGYFVEPDFLFSTIIDAIGRKENILPQLERSLKKIEDSIIGQESEDDFGGLFSDIDLAVLYGVETRRLNEQVRRNTERFPEDFMFQLTKDEALSSRSQFAILNESQASSKSQIATLKSGPHLGEPHPPGVW